MQSIQVSKRLNDFIEAPWLVSYRAKPESEIFLLNFLCFGKTFFSFSIQSFEIEFVHIFKIGQTKVVAILYHLLHFGFISYSHVSLFFFQCSYSLLQIRIAGVTLAILQIRRLGLTNMVLIFPQTLSNFRQVFFPDFRPLTTYSQIICFKEFLIVNNLSLPFMWKSSWTLLPVLHTTQ